MERDLTLRLNKIERKLDALIAALEKAQQADESQLIPINVAAKRLNISTAALRARAKRGSINCQQDPTNKRYYFNEETINKLAY